MAKKTSPSFVISLELTEQPILFSVAKKELEICRVMYNFVLGKYLRLEKQMKREQHYRRMIRQYKAVSQKLEIHSEDKKLISDKKSIQDTLKRLREKYQLTEYASHTWVKAIREHFGNKVNSAVAQKTATRAWNTFSKKLFGKAKKVRFLKRGEMDSFEGKSNTTGWRCVNGRIVYKDWYTFLKIKEKDPYSYEIIRRIEEKTSFSYVGSNKEKLQDHYRVKYVRMVKKEIRGKFR